MSLERSFVQTDHNGERRTDGRNVADALFYIGDQLMWIKEEMTLARIEREERQKHDG